jgi:hypothetical protein
MLLLIKGAEERVACFLLETAALRRPRPSNCDRRV